MVRKYEGQLRAGRRRFAVVASRFNESITTKLVEGALAAFAEHGVANDAIDLIWVPGAFEIPFAADYAADSQEVSAVVCVGAVIRGETTHDQHINSAVSEALMEIGLRQFCPVLFGVLTCDTLEQAIHRSGGNHGNKGYECALAALRMADLVSQLNASYVPEYEQPAGQGTTAPVGEEHGAS